MFDKAKDLLIIEKIKVIIEFTKKIANYLSKKGKPYTLLKDKDVINEILNYGYPHHIEITINNIGILLESHCNKKGSIEYYFGIWKEYENKQTKIIRKKLKNSIQAIFSDFKYRERNPYWIFISYIDIEKDKPQEIAEVMIKLYELLKKEIK